MEVLVYRVHLTSPITLYEEFRKVHSFSAHINQVQISFMPKDIPTTILHMESCISDIEIWNINNGQRKVQVIHVSK